jgi:ATP-dependent Clp protease ATP-binding subunit ClpC
MFERFTDRARRVVVLAQEEARMLNHNYIGTEHLLLGLVGEGEGVACKALDSLGISLTSVRTQVEDIIGRGQAGPSGHIPFTPRAKKVLEFSLREALQLGHNYIGTEHILLGVVREGEGVAAQVLQKLGADLRGVRQAVMQLLSGYTGSAQAEPYPDADIAAALLGMLDRGRRLQQLAERLARHLSEALDDPSITPELVVKGLLPNPERLQFLEDLFGTDRDLLPALTELEIRRAKLTEDPEDHEEREDPESGEPIGEP